MTHVGIYYTLALIKGPKDESRRKAVKDLISREKHRVSCMPLVIDRCGQIAESLGNSNWIGRRGLQTGKARGQRRDLLRHGGADVC